jgi:hypothetical protein
MEAGLQTGRRADLKVGPSIPQQLEPDNAELMTQNSELTTSPEAFYA